MDAVPKNQRARWNSLESITRMTWSGSAFLGGFLTDRFGFRVCFLITAIVYSCATLPLLLLVPLVRRLEARQQEAQQKLQLQRD